MTVVRFSTVCGRPLGEHKGSPSRYTWCAWWTCEPCFAPLTPPDAFGGAPGRGDVPGLVQQVAPAGAEIKWLSANWAQEWRHVQRHGVGARAELHEQRERQHEEWRREARARFADPLMDWQWRAGRDSLRALTSSLTPEWATLLGLDWPKFTRADLAQAWRARARDAHPDRGGSHEAFVALERARAAARAHLGVS